MAVKITPAGWNGSSEVFILSLLHNWIILLDPSCWFTDTDTHTVKHTHCAYGCSNTVTPCYLLLASFVHMDHLETLVCCGWFGDALKGRVNTLQCTPCDPRMFSSDEKSLWTIHETKVEFLNTEESITVGFKTVQLWYWVVSRNEIHLSVVAKWYCFLT